MNTTEDDSDSSTSPVNSDQDYVAVESPPPIEEAIWEEFEKHLKQTQKLLLDKPKALYKGYHAIKQMKVCAEMKRFEEKYQSLKRKLTKRHADLLNPNDQENRIVDLESKVAKIEADLKSKEAIELIKWKPVTDGKLGSDAVAGGKEDGDIAYVGRTMVNGLLVPGKIIKSRESPAKSFCHVITSERKHAEFEYLVKPSFGTLAWKPASRGRVPTGAVVGGKTADGEPLFVGRTEFEERSEKHLIIGMVQPSEFALQFLGDYCSRTSNEYEVLCHFYD